MTQEEVALETQKPDLPPPRGTRGPIIWMRKNLFATPFDAVLTIFALYLLWTFIPPLIDWLFISSTIQGNSREACIGIEGACWTMVKARFGFLMYGFYPESERWRPNLALALLLVTILPILFKSIPGQRFARWGLLIYPFVAFYLLRGGWGLPAVETQRWGGLMLTLSLSVVAIAASLPLGILLALGRRSTMPIIRFFCIGFIELVRAVPLVNVLFMASLMLPLFLPEGITIDQVLRAMVGLSLFASAYMAEVIRGGLQAIPKGQYEAAKAMGLPYWHCMRLIILPQALKIVIPGIVNTFIGMFKDTSLVAIIALFDLLGAAKSSVTNVAWLGYDKEAYIFAAFVYFFFCFSMSRYSIYLEKRLQTGHKR
ncbi:MAG: amino acid ABC transporter permease [Alphaproteobacteria bacterium]